MESTIEFPELVREVSKYFVLNVRTHEENSRDGVIPGSHSIPVIEVPDSINGMSDADFQEKYKFVKPKKDTPIVVHCGIGLRAKKTYDFLVENQYTNVRLYKGSFKDWKENEGPIAKLE